MLGENIMWNPTAIKNLRKSLDMTQADLAAECGVTINTISRWEIGQNRPDKRSCGKLQELQSAGKNHIGKCLWCGSTHGTTVETEACARSRQEIQDFIRGADEEKSKLKGTGLWATIREGVAVTIAEETNWHLARAYQALSERSQITTRNAEEIMRELFASHTELQRHV